jgi:Capsular polysaccharide synthesis protein
MLRSNIVFFIIVAIILIGFAITFSQKTNYNMVPRKIWTYWNSSDSAINKIPKTVKLCMESWKKYNPDYEIVLLTKQNYHNYVTIPVDISSHPNFNDNPTRFSDLVRIYTLAEHGGVWIDASVLLKKPLDDWLFPKYAEFSGFYIKSFTKSNQYPIIENWFFACNKSSPFVNLWKKEFTEIARFPNVEKYIESRKEMGVDFEWIPVPIYLAQHVAAQKVLQIDKYPLDTLLLRKAEDGPLKYLVETKWNSEKAMRLACLNKNLQSPMLKMRGSEREVMEKFIDFDLSDEKCGWLN